MSSVELEDFVVEKPLCLGYKLFKQFRELCEGKLKEGDSVAIFTHPCPDPDAIGSQMGLAWLLEKTYNVNVDMFISGQISHPQNLTMEKLLGPKLIPIEDYNSKNYNLNFLVDTIPSNAGRRDIVFDVVIDHHVELPVANGDSHYLFINLHTGSACATIYGLIHYYGVVFDEEEVKDQNVATSMLVGIYTDTCSLLGDRYTESDREAYNDLFNYRNPESLREIAQFKRPRQWITLKADAAREAIFQEAVAVVGLGVVSMKNRDIISEQATEMLLWSGINLSISFALVDGNMVQGSVRSNCASVSAAKLAKMLGVDKGGDGWGHPGAAGYNYPFTGFSIDKDEDEETQIETWCLLKKRESNRILKMLKK